MFRKIASHAVIYIYSFYSNWYSNHKAILIFIQGSAQSVRRCGGYEDRGPYGFRRVRRARTSQMAVRRMVR